MKPRNIILAGAALLLLLLWGRRALAGSANRGGMNSTRGDWHKKKVTSSKVSKTHKTTTAVSTRAKGTASSSGFNWAGVIGSLLSNFGKISVAVGPGSASGQGSGWRSAFPTAGRNFAPGKGSSGDATRNRSFSERSQPVAVQAVHYTYTAGWAPGYAQTGATQAAGASVIYTGNSYGYYNDQTGAFIPITYSGGQWVNVVQDTGAQNLGYGYRVAEPASGAGWFSYYSTGGSLQHAGSSSGNGTGGNQGSGYDSNGYGGGSGSGGYYHSGDYSYGSGGFNGSVQMENIQEKFSGGLSRVSFPAQGKKA